MEDDRRLDWNMSGEIKNADTSKVKQLRGKFVAFIRGLYEKYSKLLRQSIRFAIVGVANTLLDFGIYTGLCYIMSYATAQVISYLCAMVFSMFINKVWTFKQRESLNPRQIMYFVAVNVISLLVAIGVLTLCKESFYISNNTVSKIISIPFSLAVNFIGNRMIVFKDAAQK